MAGRAGRRQTTCGSIESRPTAGKLKLGNRRGDGRRPGWTRSNCAVEDQTRFQTLVAESEDVVSAAVRELLELGPMPTDARQRMIRLGLRAGSSSSDSCPPSGT